ncbi:peptidoglycan D,D-transpeptidase FtsI family protein [Huintestinicola sp.]|uniref:peptidoglycan D,D-transpeptidase FtsI family protein n=1 Tax=Huintestinicola sp. TaxID=2981661 RepID=UPI003D7C6A4D
MESLSKRLLACAGLTGFTGIFLLWRLMVININSDVYMKYDMSAPREVTVVSAYGEIFDRNGRRLVNRSEEYIAVINPETADKNELLGHITDLEKYESCIDGDALFLCGVDTTELKSVTVIPVSERYGDDCLCAHIIGYTSDGHGVCGLEQAYDSVLREPKSSVTLSYSVDARGDLLEGDGIDMRWVTSFKTGICTSIDYAIQRAAEDAMKDVDRGAAIVMDISTGELCAVVSKPSFDPSHPEASLNSQDSPFINRAFSAYSVGSIFKLVTAGAALEYDISEEYAYDCTGSITVRQDEFGCHRFGGHGRMDMRTAMVESCNPYFICLGQDLPAEYFHDFAAGLGFGEGKYFAPGITSAKGNLPSIGDLLVPEEKANFSFGQGKLTATPLQITMLTAAIANGGECPSPVLINGVTDRRSDKAVSAEIKTFTRVMKKSTADKLKDFMISTMYKANSAAIPEFTTGGGKTSTAQTWTYDEYGNEKLNCWFTGFFPADEPRYAVTVMIEEGVSGNITCGPVFKSIADAVVMNRYR